MSPQLLRLLQQAPSDDHQAIYSDTASRFTAGVLVYLPGINQYQCQTAKSFLGFLCCLVLLNPQSVQCSVC